MTDSEVAEIPAETAPAAPAPLRWLTVLGRRPFLMLALLGLALWLPGILSLPPLDRDESRFAQSSRQMVESGNWVDIRFGQVPRYKKPAGIYWLQAASTEIAGLGRDDQIWTYRLPSLLGAIAASWLTVWCALAVAGSEAALLAGLLMLGSVLLTAEATIATTDAVLLACWVCRACCCGCIAPRAIPRRRSRAPLCGGGRLAPPASWSSFRWCRVSQLPQSSA